MQLYKQGVIFSNGLNGPKARLKLLVGLSNQLDDSQLKAYFEKEIKDAKDQDVLLSLHMKATMMKVSDPIIFGHGVKTFYSDVFAKHQDAFEKVGVNPNNGIGDVYNKIVSLPDDKQTEIKKRFTSCL